MSAREPSAAGSERGFDVFLAYNSKDEGADGRAQVIKAAIEQDGLRVWFAKGDVVAGEESQSAMAKGLRASKCCFMLYGEHGLGIWQGGYERALATRLSVENQAFRTFAVLLPGAKEGGLPDDLQNYTSVDLRDGFDATGLTEEGLVKVIAAARGTSPTELAESRARSAAKPRRYRALLVGVSKYANPELKKLHGPPIDLANVEQALSEVGMPPGLKWEIEPCQEPDYDSLRNALLTLFATEATRDDTLLFYYSGHGVVDEDDSYVYATNTNPEQKKLTAISAEQIVEIVGQSPAGEKVIILDCCHAARIEDTAYEKLEGNVAVIVASRGPAQDSNVISEPSPYTAALVRAVRDPGAYGDTGLTVETLLRALKRRGHEPWTNSRYTRDIVLAARPGRSVDSPMERPAAISIDIPATAVADDRLRLVRELAAMLDALLATAAEDDHIPTSLVRSAVQVLAEEFGCVLTEEQINALRGGSDGRPKTCAVRFADATARSRLGDLPWEYLASPPAAATPEDLFAEESPRVSFERVFAVSGTKQAAPTLQKVALFSSLLSTEDKSLKRLTADTQGQLQGLGLLSAEDVNEATWGAFGYAPDNADVVILQAPVRIAEDGVKVLFAPSAAGKDLDPVPAESVANVLQKRTTMTWLLIETVGNDSRDQPGRAARRLAQILAINTKRAVVAICHSRAYLSCLARTDKPTSFLAELLREVDGGSFLDEAAQAARESVVWSLGVNNPAVVGVPIVLRPEPAEPSRPVARRDAT